MRGDSLNPFWQAYLRRAIAIPTAAIQCIALLAMLMIIVLMIWQSAKHAQARIEAAQWRERYKLVIVSQLEIVDRAIEARKVTDATFMLNAIGLYIQQQAPDDSELLTEFRNRVEALIIAATKDKDSGDVDNATSDRDVGETGRGTRSN